MFGGVIRCLEAFLRCLEVLFSVWNFVWRCYEMFGGVILVF